ncbi:hypothetical protein CO669_18575 [Bradyrhizobium sp. Y36]|nr:hypothetical protein CO669_18575 [Bradyrhizobium sp. Y36]
MTFSAETRDQIAAALVAHGEDERVLTLVGRKIRKGEQPSVLANVLRVWPADADGLCRVRLTDVEGLLVWRSMALYDIAAGRGLEADLAGRLGVRTDGAYDCFRKLTCPRARHRLSAYDRATRSHTAHRWTRDMQSIVDGKTFVVYPDERYRFDVGGGSDYAALLGLGLVLPAIDCESGVTAHPSSLLMTPVPDPEPLELADDEALAALSP